MSSTTPATERQRYSAELAAYTLRQFFVARTTLDQHQAAAAKLPAVHNRHLALLNPQGQNADRTSQVFKCMNNVQPTQQVAAQ